MQQMTESEKGLIISMYNNRYKVSEIVQMLPYKEGTSMRFIKELRQKGLLKKENRQRFTPRQIEVQKLHSEGYNAHKITEQTGYALTTIYQTLSDLKLSCPRPKHNYKKRVEVTLDKLSSKTQQILAAVKSGKKSRDICQEFQITRQYLSLLKKKYQKRYSNGL